MKKIVLTGGGTAGHVTPNIALIPSLKEHGYEIYYIGSKGGMEQKLIEFYGSVPGHKGRVRGAQVSEADRSGYCLFQRRLCRGSRCLLGIAPSYTGHLA